ncbi:hypothetical protein [Shinella sp.]|jgi:hypothetical protein|uniref:hypothetical protein n=1 Tax=Shinella sp. TaxID=1870904 RepID=UPI003F731182
MTETTAIQSPLADFVVAEVRRQTDEGEIRTLVEKKIGEIIVRAVDDQFRYGDLHKQITKAVGETLQIGERLDLPAYGTMVMALLRNKLDEKIHDLISAKLASDMDEILRIAPKETKFSDVVKKMVEDEDQHDRYGDHVSVVVDPSDYRDGEYWIGLDNESDKRSWVQCETHFHVDKAGKISSLTVGHKDVKKVVTSGPYWGYQKMIFAAYACGATLIMDDLDPPTHIGEEP